MKKILCTVLVFALVLGLAACGSGDAKSAGGSSATKAPEEAATLQVGYAKVNITPEESVPLRGYGNTEKRMSQGLLDYIWATCIAVTDADGNTVLLVAMDLCGTSGPIRTMRKNLAAKLKLPEQNVMFCGSHTHSAPDTGKTSIASIQSYNTKLEADLNKCAQAALDDRSPVTGMYHTSIETESLNFVRRYIMNDGTYAGDNYGDYSSGYKAHETEVDNVLQLVKFTRKEGKDVVITNFQTHPHRTGGSTKYDISADIVGVYRDELEKSLDCNALYFSGGSGNVNPTSRITEENVYQDYRSHGKAMANFAVKAAESWTELEMGKVQTVRTDFVANINHSEDHLVVHAQLVSQRFKDGYSSREAAAPYADLGIETAYHANSIIAKAGLGKTYTFQLYSVSIGDFGLAFAPFELFDTLGVMIKEGSPFGATFVCCYANVSLGYMPTEAAFAIGGYEVYTCEYESGTGEKIVGSLVDMLTQLHSAK